MTPKYLNDSDPWYLAEDIIDVDFRFSQLWLSSFVNELEKSIGRSYKKVLSIHRGYNLTFYFGENDSNNFAEYILKKIVAKPSFGQKINKKIRLYSDRLKHKSQEITSRAIANLSDKELADLYLLLDDIHTELYSWGWLPNAVDMFHNNFTDYLRLQLNKLMPAKKVIPALVTLSVSPEKSIIQQEHESFLRLVILKQQGSDAFVASLQSHQKHYFYLKHMWLPKGGTYSKNYYLSEIEKYLAAGQDANYQLQQEQDTLEKNLTKQSKLIGDFHIPKKLVKLFDIYADFAITKLYRRDAQIYWAYKMDLLIREISKRIMLSDMETRFLFPWEIADLLRQKKLDRQLKQSLPSRTKYCVYYAEKGKDLIFTDEEAHQIEQGIESEVNTDVSELRGQTANLGKARGKAIIVNSTGGMKKMKKGDILVSIATNPDIVPSMKKAAAIVTEQGGITSHAAIIARELSIPCVIGTKIATKVFKDGDLVEVDATQGIVKKINK